jgi:HK97 family phage portal protein
MGIFSRSVSTASSTINNIKKIFGVNISLAENNNDLKVENISTIQSCVRILVENVSRLPVIVRDKDGKVIDNHIISKLFNRSFNNYVSSDKGRKIIEKDRNINGNGFALIKYDNKGVLLSITPLVYESVRGISLKNDNLFYLVDHSYNEYSGKNIKETINGQNILHFTTPNISNFVGISPIKSLVNETLIRQRANETMVNYYKNNALSPFVLSSSISDMSQVKAIKEFTENFNIDNTGVYNSGKIIKLPPGMKLDAIDYKLIDADLINTLKFTNQEIISAFGIPSFLMSYETTQSIENQSLEFKTFTLNSILTSYKSEMECKLLTTNEIDNGYYIDFDYSILMDADLKTKSESYSKLITSGLITPNEALKRLGHSLINDPSGDKHYVMFSDIQSVEDKDKKEFENNE